MDRFEKVEYLSKLCRIGLSSEEQELFSSQLGNILEYVEQLKEVDVEGVEPMYHPLPITNRMRKDTTGASIDREKALKNAPQKKDGFFVVPRIIEE